MYSDEMGLDPTLEMLECYERISQRLHDSPGDMEFIKRELSEKKEDRRRGAYFCDYRTFTEICHVSRRNMAVSYTHLDVYKRQVKERGT